MGNKITKTYISEEDITDLKRQIPKIVDKILDIPYKTNDINTYFSIAYTAINELLYLDNKNISIIKKLGINDDYIRGISVGLTSKLLCETKIMREELIKYLENILCVIKEIN